MNRLALFLSLLAGANVAVASEGPQNYAPIDLNAPPAWFRDGSKDQASAALGRQVIKGRVSATRDRAFKDARKQLDAVVSQWLVDSGLPKDWKPSGKLIDGMIVGRHCEPVRHELGVEGAEEYETLYVAAYLVDFSKRQQKIFANANHHEIKARRMSRLGGVLAFVLSCLAAFVGYVRADDASKGYYTNRLRLAALAAVGGAGAAIIHWVA